MLLSDLIHDLPVTVHGSADVRIRGVSEDSRRIEGGWLFVARPGKKHDGQAFITQAIERGAAAVLAGDRVGAPVSLVCQQPARVGAILAERWHGTPSRRLGLVGVTGTNGKTTVAWLLRQLLALGGRKCGLIGTIEIDEGAGSKPASLTTPAAEDLSGSLARMIGHGCDFAVMEASSHALHQHRVAGLAFRVGIFTNLSGDHLDYHGSMDAYADAKALLFAGLPHEGLAIVNADDDASERMVRDCRARVLRCSLGSKADATVRVSAEGLESRVELIGRWGEMTASLSLVGDHNAMNALQAVAAAHALGLSPEAIERALPALRPPPGRLEPVIIDGASGPRVLVDYAHTDDALEKALLAVAGRKGDGKLWVVFGCGGDRDRTKRPRMGAVAARLADRVFVTSDNPRTEEPAAIVREVVAGITTGVWHASDPDRESAIHAVIAQADPEDVIVIAGKGHEDYQIVRAASGETHKRDFDDRLVARAALLARSGAIGGVR